MKKKLIAKLQVLAELSGEVRWNLNIYCSHLGDNTKVSVEEDTENSLFRNPLVVSNTLPGAIDKFFHEEPRLLSELVEPTDLTLPETEEDEAWRNKAADDGPYGRIE